MATQEDLYYQNANYQNPHVFPMKPKARDVSPSFVMPKMPQPVMAKDRTTHHHQHRDTATPQSMRIHEPEHEQQPTSYRKGVAPPPMEDGQHTNVGCKPQQLNPPLRGDNLKRRPSLREAVSSLRTSKVAKRLRRQGKGGSDAEDHSDTGVSASESDQAVGSVYQQKKTSTPVSSTQDNRRFSSVSTLMDGLQSSLNLDPPSRARGSSTVSQTSSQAIDCSDSVSTHTGVSSRSSTSKPSRSTDEEDFEGLEDDDSDRVSRRPSSLVALGPEQPQLFACPYAKYDSKRYSAANLEELNYRGCSQSYLTDLARVKQHLYRVHERPQHHCPTCFETFKNQTQCIKHYEMRSCASRPCPFTEKMSTEQLMMIKKKNRGTDPYLGWYEIYKTLFPGTHLPMSPYAAFTATTDTLESFMDYVVRELPTRLQSQLGFNNPMAESVRNSLSDALREIRRDFNPSLQPEVRTQTPIKPHVTNAQHDEASMDLNFHEMVTMGDLQQDQLQIEPPATMDVPRSGMYGYSPTSAQSHMFPPSDPLSIQYSDQRQHQNMSHYPHHQLEFNLQSHGLMHNNHPGPITAIFNPSEQESEPDYFLGNHQGQELLPALRVVEAGNWLPNMLTVIPHSNVNSHGVPGTMGGYYHGAYHNQ